MATTLGNDGVVKVGANAVAEVASFTLVESTATVRDTAMGDTYESHKVGLKSWRGTLTTHWDDSDTNGQEALTNGASVTLNLLPEGDTTGDEQYSGTATITEVTTENNFDNTLVRRSFAFEGNGTLTKGTAS